MADHQTDIKKRLRNAHLRPTRQRVLIASLLFGDEKCHVNADSLAKAIADKGAHIATATIYNCLHQFEAAGLLQRVPSGEDGITFDTNITHHHHFLVAETGELIDIPLDKMQANVPQAPDGYEIDSIEMVVKIRKSAG